MKNKEKAIKIVTNYQMEHIQHLEKSINEKRETMDVDEGEVLDLEDYSRQTEAGDLVLRLKKQVSIAKNDLKFLQEIPLVRNDKIVLGSLVETLEMFFYVAIPTNIFEYEEKTLVGISAKAPIYKSMMNKVKGETFQVGSKKYTIVNVC